jgi:hypothetical protein
MITPSARVRASIVLASIAVTLSVTQPVAAQVKQPTATGTGGAIATVDVLASQAGLRSSGPAATRSTPGWPPRRCSG